jgi:hypothetical protein
MFLSMHMRCPAFHSKYSVMKWKYKGCQSIGVRVPNSSLHLLHSRHKAVGKKARCKIRRSLIPPMPGGVWGGSECGGVEMWNPRRWFCFFEFFSSDGVEDEPYR